MSTQGLLFPQTGKELKDIGMQRAVDHADRVVDSWSDKAYKLLKIYIITKLTAFQCEDFRGWCKNKIEEPPSKRAFGAVIVRAKKNLLIKHVGYGVVENPKAHRTPASIWLKL